MANNSEKWKSLTDNFHTQNKNLHIRAFRDFLSASHLKDKYMDSKLSNDGINRTQRMIILEILAKGGYMTPTEISKITHHPIDTIFKSIDVLTKMGLTRSHQSRKDRRSRQVTLTDKGLELAEKTLPARYLAFSQAMACFSKEEARLYSELLRRLMKQMINIQEESSADFKYSLKSTSSDESN
jgi:DNA-binding MarR family transcriptional regulator